VHTDQAHETSGLLQLDAQARKCLRSITQSPYRHVDSTPLISVPKARVNSSILPLLILFVTTVIHFTILYCTIRFYYTVLAVERLLLRPVRTCPRPLHCSHLRHTSRSSLCNGQIGLNVSGMALSSVMEAWSYMMVENIMY
jgi:hypothetical protein